MRRRRLRRSFRRRCLRASSGGDKILPDVLDRVQVRGPRRQEDRCDVFGHAELAGDGRPGPVEKQHGVGALGEVPRDFVEVELHYVSVGPGRWLRTDRRCHSAGRLAVLVSSRAWPTAEPGRSSGRCGPRPYMRLLLSRHDRALPTMVAQRISRRTVVDWGSSYPQRALRNLTYGPIAGHGTLDRNHNASCTRLRSRLTRPT